MGEFETDPSLVIETWPEIGALVVHWTILHQMIVLGIKISRSSVFKQSRNVAQTNFNEEKCVLFRFFSDGNFDRLPFY